MTPPLSRLPEIIDPEHLPTTPLARYYIADCPLQDPEEPLWFEAESAVIAAGMAQTLYGTHWGSTVMVAWRDEATGEVRRFYPRLEDAMMALEETLADRGNRS